MVDLSDVRSMSRPGSPLSVFPIPCIIRPVVNKPTHADTPSARMAVVLMKGSYPGRRAPSTRQGQRGQRRDKQLAYSPHPGLLHSLFFTSDSFSLSLSRLYPPSVPDLVYKNQRTANKPPHWQPGKQGVARFIICFIPIYCCIWMTNHCHLITANAHRVLSICACLLNKNIPLQLC